MSNGFRDHQLSHHAVYGHGGHHGPVNGAMYSNVQHQGNASRQLPNGSGGGHLRAPLGGHSEVSPGPPSILNPHSVGNNAMHPHHQHAAHHGASSYYPYMLPYPYNGYGVPGVSPEQQAGLAELLLQQQRLNAAAAQLIGMPPGSSPALPPVASNGNSMPPYSLLFPGLMGGGAPSTPSNGYPGSNPSAAQLYQSYQQQYGGQQPQPQQHSQLTQIPSAPSSKPGSAGNLYPDLGDLIKNENLPPPIQHHSQSSSSSNGVYNRHGHPHNHSRSDSSNGASPASSHYHHSVSPQPPAYPTVPDYNSSNNGPMNGSTGSAQYPYSNNANHLFQKPSSGQANNSNNVVVGKGKRGFESEADSLLNELKKKRYDGNNNVQCKRINSACFCIHELTRIFSSRSQSSNAWTACRAISSSQTRLPPARPTQLQCLLSRSTRHSRLLTDPPILLPRTSAHEARVGASRVQLKLLSRYPRATSMTSIICSSPLDSRMSHHPSTMSRECIRTPSHGPRELLQLSLSSMPTSAMFMLTILLQRLDRMLAITVIKLSLRALLSQTILLLLLQAHNKPISILRSMVSRRSNNSHRNQSRACHPHTSKVPHSVSNSTSITLQVTTCHCLCPLIRLHPRDRFLHHTSPPILCVRLP